MGNQKLKWKAEEEEALLAGIAKHGSGKWKNILRDPEFSDQLSHRSNIDLKDKWRNLNVAPNSQGSNYKARPTKVKEEGVTVAIVGADAAATTTPSTIDDSSSPPASSLQRSASSELINYDSCNTTVVDAKNAPRYDGMIFEALSTLADANGSDVSSIFHFIEPRHEVPANFRRTLSSRLRRLAGQCKLVKVSTSKSLQNFYKIPESSGVIRTVPAPAPTPKAPKPKETSTKPRQTHNQIPAVSREMIEEAAITAACKVVEAENKIDIAKLAVEESEKVNKLAEETELLLLIAKEIHEKCCRGEIVLLA